MDDRMPGDQRSNVGGDGLGLRPEQPGDADFLLQLFRATHGRLLAGFDPALVETLLRQQHAGQTMTYRSHFPAARFDIVVDDGIPVGRLVVDDRHHVLHVVDIALMPAAQGRGRGSGLIAAVMRRAAESGRGVTATVHDDNLASRAMFARLRFAFRPDGLATSEAIWSPP